MLFPANLQSSTEKKLNIAQQKQPFIRNTKIPLSTNELKPGMVISYNLQTGKWEDPIFIDPTTHMGPSKRKPLEITGASLPQYTSVSLKYYLPNYYFFSEQK